MNKQQFISAMAKESGMTKKDTEIALNAFTKSVTDALLNGDKVSLVGFGVFEVRDRVERVIKSPSTGEPMVIPACKALTFRTSKGLKKVIRGS